MEAIKRVSAARRSLVLDHPFFGVLSLKLAIIEDAGVKTFMVDGRQLRVNPDYALNLKPQELVGVVAHEVLHCANGHTWRRGDRERKCWNEACDYAINPIVMDAGLVLPQGALDGSPYRGMSAEEIYERLMQQQAQDAGEDRSDDQSNDQSEEDSGNHSGQTPDKGSEDNSGDNDPDSPEDGNSDSDDSGDENQESEAGGKPAPQADGSCCGEVADCTSEQMPEIQADWSAAVLNAAKQAEAMGRLPAGMERRVEEIKNPPQDWRSILRRFVQQNTRTDYGWQQPNPRYLYGGWYLPSLRSETMPPMVVAIDTSGSIDDLTLSQFAREVESIVDDMQPERVHVIYCDDEIHGVDVFERGEPIVMAPKGYGGTDFRPVFDYVENEGIQPACLLYLTDMMGDFPAKAPDYPVLWGDTFGFCPEPWGERVQIRCT